MREGDAAGAAASPRDNMSAGLQRVADALAETVKNAPAAQAAVQRAAKAAVDAEKSKADAAEKETARAEAYRRRIQINSAKMNSTAAQQEADARIQEEQRVAKARLRMQINSAKMASEAAQREEADRIRQQARADAFERTREMQRIIREEQAAARARKEAKRAEEARERMQRAAEAAAARAARKAEAEAQREERARRSAMLRTLAEFERAERARVVANRRATAELLRQEERLAREERRLARETAAAQARAMRERERATAAESKDKKKGMFGAMVGANIVGNLASSFIMGGISTTINAVKEFYSRAIEENVKYEQAISATSAAMYTMGISPSMEVAEASASRLFTTMRKLAAKLPGEAADYVEVFQRTIPKAIASGMRDTQKYAEFVSKYTAVAIQRGVGAKVAASNLQLMLQGTARSATKMAAILSDYTGKTVQQIMEMSKPARFALLQDAVEKASAGMSAAMNKADAVFGELKTHQEDLYRIGGQPLFDSAVGSAKDLNAWLEKNKIAITDLTKTIARPFADTLRGLVVLMTQFSDKVLGVFGGSAATTNSPQARLREIQEFASSWKAGIPIYGTYRIVKEAGEMQRIMDDVEKSAEEARLISEAGKLYKPREAALGLSVDPKGSIAKMAEQTETLFRFGMFDRAGKRQDEAATEFLRYKGVSAESRQKVHDILMAHGIFRPIADELAEDISRSPKDRAASYNDFRYSRFDIRQEFAEGFDPDRIAVAFATDLGKMATAKLGAASSMPGGAH